MMGRNSGDGYRSEKLCLWQLYEGSLEQMYKINADFTAAMSWKIGLGM